MPRGAALLLAIACVLQGSCAALTQPTTRRALLNGLAGAACSAACLHVRPASASLREDIASAEASLQVSAQGGGTRPPARTLRGEARYSPFEFSPAIAVRQRHR